MRLLLWNGLTGSSLAWAAALLAGGWMAVSAGAGEKIILGQERTKTAEPLRAKLPSSVTRSVGDLWHATPLDEVPVPDASPSIPFDPKTKRKLKAQQEERRNWMFYAPGELTDKVEEPKAFGKEVDPKQPMEEEEKTSPMFRDLQKSPAGVWQQNLPKKPSAGMASPDAAKNQAEDEKPLDRRRSESFSASGTERRKPEAGAHTSKELDPSRLFEGKQGGSVLGATQKDLREALGLGPSLSRGQLALRDDFKHFLENTQPAAVLGSPVSSAAPLPDFLRGPEGGTLPRVPAVKAPAPKTEPVGSPMPESFRQGMSLPGPWMPAASGLPDRGSGAWPDSRTDRSSRPGESSNFEIPRDRGRSLGGH
jgi:hypothetical protein